MERTAVTMKYKYDTGEYICHWPIRWDEQVYSHVNLDGTTLAYDVMKLNRIAVQRGAPTEAYAVRQQDVMTLITERGIETAHLRRLAGIDNPGIMVRFDDDSELIVDGNHRMVARFMAGLDYMEFHRLSETEAKLALLDLPDDFIKRWVAGTGV